jgi:hypothetical protein
MCEHYYNHPEGFDPPYHNTGTFDIIQKCERFSTLEAKAGDVILLHGLLPHTNSLNYLHYARIITNPHACLKEPLNFNREDGNYVRAYLSNSTPADDTDIRASLNKLFSSDWAANPFPNGRSPENERITTLEPTDSGELEFGRSLTDWLQRPKRRAWTNATSSPFIFGERLH